MGCQISVIIPTYNGSAFINEALQSVFQQTLLPMEIIVVDDASTDGTPALVEKIAQHSPVPLHLLRLEKNSGGPARPMNVGIEAATGELIAILDHDDVFLPDKLQEQVTTFSRAPHLSFCFGLYGAYENPEKIKNSDSLLHELALYSKKRDGYCEIPGDVVFELLMKYGPYMGGYPAFIFPRELWKKKGGLDETLLIGSDYDVECWFALQGDVGFIPKVCYLRRTHSNNLSKRSFETFMDHGHIKARYIACRPHILQNKELSNKLHGEIFGLVYWLQKSGHYHEAFYYLRLYARIWEHNFFEVIWYRIKLLIHRMISIIYK